MAEREKDEHDRRDRHVELWNAISKQADDIKELGEDAAVVKAKVESMEAEMRENRAVAHENVRQLSTIQANLQHLLEVEKGRFMKMVATITAIVGLMNLIMVYASKFIK